ncbi:MAG: hypothetical protein ACRDTF_01050 [Pseudonocardiaceae bacterium]
MTKSNDQTIKIEITITGDGNGARRRVFEAPANATDATELMSRIGKSLAEFKTVEWVTEYL